MKASNIFTIVLVCFVLHSNAQKAYTKDEYINRFKSVAIAEMQRTGIPASITLGQGMIESNNGNSKLACEANNHFGIKCHKWEGKTFYQDDDTDNECFRKYETVWESYRDHSNFLTTAKRYAFLFDNSCNDYTNWAKGLKKAGYATNSNYARDLIRVIEDNKLYEFDCENNSISEKPAKETFEVKIYSRKVYQKNDVKYIIVEPNDNIDKITHELNLMRWELRRYNELGDSINIKPGQVLYIQPKRRKAEKGKDYHCVKAGETMYQISQLYAVKLKKLYRKNRLEIGSGIVEGQKIWLRKKKPKSESNNCS